MNKFRKLIFKLGSSISKKSPEIAIGIGIAGFIFATVSAVKATPKAIEKIEEAEEEKGEPLTKKEVVKVAWKCYIPTAVSVVASTGCIIGANSIHHKRNAALAAAYSLSESTLKTYKEKVKDIVSEKDLEKIETAVAEEKVNSIPPEQRTKCEVRSRYAGTQRYFDPFGNMIYTDREKMQALEDRLNLRLYDEIYLSVDEYLEELGINSHMSMKNDIGWNQSKGKIHFKYDPVTDFDGETCTVMSFVGEVPKYDFRYYY